MHIEKHGEIRGQTIAGNAIKSSRTKMVQPLSSKINKIIWR